MQAAHAKGIADKVNKGSYTAADASQDFGQCVALAIEFSSKYVGMVAQCFGTYAVASSGDTVTSQTFSTAEAAQSQLGLSMKVSLTNPLTGAEGATREEAESTALEKAAGAIA